MNKIEVDLLGVLCVPANFSGQRVGFVMQCFKEGYRIAKEKYLQNITDEEFHPSDFQEQIIKFASEPECGALSLNNLQNDVTYLIVDVDSNTTSFTQLINKRVDQAPIILEHFRTVCGSSSIQQFIIKELKKLMMMK